MKSTFARRLPQPRHITLDPAFITFVPFCLTFLPFFMPFFKPLRIAFAIAEGGGTRVAACRALHFAGSDEKAAPRRFRFAGSRSLTGL